MEPGFGYWMYAYYDCEIWLQEAAFNIDNYISELSQNWNIVSTPHFSPLDKTDITVNYDGVDYNWTEAIDPANGPLIDSFIFGWNRGPSGQIYQAVDVLEPGYSYWMYAYYGCTLVRPEM